MGAIIPACIRESHTYSEFSVIFFSIFSLSLSNKQTATKNKSKMDAAEMERQRNEKDAKEMQKLMSYHFEARQADDEEFAKFEAHVQERKKRRELEKKERAEKEKAKRAAEDAERERKEAEDEKARQEKEEGKKMAFIPDRSTLKKGKKDENKVSWNDKIKDLYAKMAVA